MHVLEKATSGNLTWRFGRVIQGVETAHVCLLCGGKGNMTGDRLLGYLAFTDLVGYNPGCTRTDPSNCSFKHGCNLPSCLSAQGDTSQIDPGSSHSRRTCCRHVPSSWTKAYFGFPQALDPPLGQNFHWKVWDAPQFLNCWTSLLKWLWLKIEQEGQTAGFGPCFHLPGQHILELRFIEPRPRQLFVCRK